jgi:hypothetical protein
MNFKRFTSSYVIETGFLFINAKQFPKQEFLKRVCFTRLRCNRAEIIIRARVLRNAYALSTKLRYFTTYFSLMTKFVYNLIA